ncbi:MAG: glycerophosphodiester phosphodiesterase family protein [Blautia sp.]
MVKIIEDNDFVDQCVLTSMNYNFLRQAKKINPDIKTGYTMKMSYGGLEDMDAADFFSVKYTYITESFVEHAHSLGKEVCAWTLNYQGDMQRMVNCGVDNIITDDPELVRKVILGTTDRNPGFVSLLGYALK